MKTRVIQDDSHDDPSDHSGHSARGTDTAASGPVSWIRNHRLTTFFVLSYVLGWWAWLLHLVGIWPEEMFFAVAPLVSAIIVIAVADGLAGFRDLGARIIRWRVPWYWYAIAIGLPLAVRFAGVLFNTTAGGAADPDWGGIAWTSVAMAFLLRLVNPMDGPVGEEPAWRGFAVPHLQAMRSPLVSAAILGVLVAGWHLPLVFIDDIGAIGLVTTFTITFVYVWLFNHTRGSVLLVLLFHCAQGAPQMADLGFTGADLTRQQWVECVIWTVVAIGLVVLDRAAWRTAPAAAVAQPRPRPKAQA